MAGKRNWLYPELSYDGFCRLIGFAVGGALLAGVYGMVHDWITFGISPEYFTRFKFGQFPWTAVVGPENFRAMVVGFLGTWWAGLIAGWLVARLGGRWWALLIPLACAVVAGVAADAWARSGWALGGWRELADESGVVDRAGFLRVCAIHTGAYAGAASGMVLMAVMCCRK